MLPRAVTGVRRRVYDVALEVASGGATSCFRHSKVLHVKDKIVLENKTGALLQVCAVCVFVCSSVPLCWRVFGGLWGVNVDGQDKVTLENCAVQVKQRGTPDPGTPFGTLWHHIRRPVYSTFTAQCTVACRAGEAARHARPRHALRHHIQGPIHSTFTALWHAAQVKQRGTPDPGTPFGPGRRSAATLAAGAHAPFFWDDSTLPRQVVVRLADGGPGGWLWSGGFEPLEKDDYFGVRLLHTGGDDSGQRDGGSVIVPVNIGVRRSGVVVVSFEPPESLPPYRIVNACEGVDVTVRQDIEVCCSR